VLLRAQMGRNIMTFACGTRTKTDIKAKPLEQGQAKEKAGWFQSMNDEATGYL